MWIGKVNDVIVTTTRGVTNVRRLRLGVVVIVAQMKRTTANPTFVRRQ